MGISWLLMNKEIILKINYHAYRLGNIANIIFNKYSDTKQETLEAIANELQELDEIIIYEEKK